MNVTRGGDNFPEGYEPQPLPGEVDEQERASPGRHRKPGVLAALIDSLGGGARVAPPARPAEPPRLASEAAPPAAIPAPTPAPVQEWAAAIPAAAEPEQAVASCTTEVSLTDTFRSLHQLSALCSADGEVTISVDGRTLKDWRQLPRLLAGDCHVSIGLGRRDDGSELALLRVLVELTLALKRETKAAVTLDVPDPSYRERLTRVWSEAHGLQPQQPTSQTCSDVSAFFSHHPKHM